MIFGMNEAKVRFPVSAYIRTIAKMMRLRKPEMVCSRFVDKNDHAGRRCIPGLNRDDIKRRLQLGFERGMLMCRRMKMQRHEQPHLSYSIEVVSKSN